MRGLLMDRRCSLNSSALPNLETPPHRIAPRHLLFVLLDPPRGIHFGGEARHRRWLHAWDRDLNPERHVLSENDLICRAAVGMVLFHASSLT